MYIAVAIHAFWKKNVLWGPTSMLHSDHMKSSGPIPTFLDKKQLSDRSTWNKTWLYMPPLMNYTTSQGILLEALNININLFEHNIIRWLCIQLQCDYQLKQMPPSYRTLCKWFTFSHSPSHILCIKRYCGHLSCQKLVIV